MNDNSFLPTNFSHIKGKFYIVIIAFYMTFFESKIMERQEEFQMLIAPFLVSLIGLSIACSTLSTLLSFFNDQGKRIESDYDTIVNKETRTKYEKVIYYHFAYPVFTVFRHKVILRVDFITSNLTGIFVFYPLFFGHIERYSIFKLFKNLINFTIS